MINNINDFITKWKELKLEKSYVYNFLSVEDAIYIDKYYNFDIDELFNDKKYGNEAFLNTTKNNVEIFMNIDILNIIYAIRCFVAFKNPFYTEDFWDIDIKKLNNNAMADILIYNRAYLDRFEKMIIIIIIFQKLDTNQNY